MCQLTIPYKKAKIFTGYKMVLKRNNRYYSPYTGLVYYPRKIPIMKKYRTNTIDGFLSKGVLNEVGRFYEKKMEGKTGVFITKSAAENFREQTDDTDCVLLKITIKGGLIRGIFANSSIIAGEYIESVKELT